ncbi:MAG: ROK family protein, partial [Anaerolineae bacterium]|nr:ROK family protein [Anaerolineae bacterium]
MADRKTLLALDFGGTKLTVGLAAAGETRWLARAQAPSPPHGDASTDRRTILGLARRLLGETQTRPAAVGVSFGGPVDAARGLVLLSHHVPGWQDFPLATWLQGEFGVPAAVDNDANAGALGEWRFGAGQGCASLLYVTVSTGVGGGWVLEGRVYHGADSLAGEIGHMTVEPGGPPCTCGRRGCLEALAAGPAIARRARERLRAAPGAGARLLERVGGDVDAVTAQE